MVVLGYHYALDVIAGAALIATVVGLTKNRERRALAVAEVAEVGH